MSPIKHEGPTIRKKNLSLGGPTFYCCTDVVTLLLLPLCCYPSAVTLLLLPFCCYPSAVAACEATLVHLC